MKKELKHFEIDGGIGGNQDWFLDPLMRLGGCGAVTACDTCIWLAREHGAVWLYPFSARNLSRGDYLHFARIMKPFLRPRAGGINRLDLYINGFNAYLRGREDFLFQGAGTHRAESAYQTDIMRHTAVMPGVELACQTGQKSLRMEGLPGQRPVSAAWDAICRQIDAGFPVAMLVLHHQNPELKDYVWHWFLLCGYDDTWGAEPANDAVPCAAGITDNEVPCAAGITDNEVPCTAGITDNEVPCTAGITLSNPVEPRRKVKVVTYGEEQWLDFDKLWDTGYEERGGLVLYRWES